MFNRGMVSGAVLAAVLATGCTSLPNELGTVPGKDALALHTAFNADAPAEVAVELDWSPESMFIVFPRASNAGALPNKQVSGLSFTEYGVLDAVRMLAEDVGMTVRVEGGAMGSERYGPFTVENLSGSFAQVLEAMAEAAGFFWEVQGNTLIIRQDDQFVVNLPPVLVEDTLAGVTNTVQFLGARDAYLDRAGRTLTFTANRKGLDRVQRYLDSVRATRSLLVYDTHVLQVELREGLDTGIQWNQFAFVPNKTGLAGGAGLVSGEGLTNRVGDAIRTTVLTNTAAGLGVSVAAPTFAISSLIEFLNTQGAVRSLSSPQLTMLSGSKGSLRVGRTVTFVSKVGSNTTTGVSQVTTETESLRTGLHLELQGDVHDQTVFTRVNLSISDVTAMERFTAVGTELTLPQTADRDLDVSVRSRPGDVILLGGIHIDTETVGGSRSVAGFRDSNARARTELVLVLRARVINFVGRTAPVAQAGEAHE